MSCVLKYGTKGLLSSAISTCAKDGARPPLPTNAQENVDLLDYFLTKRNASQHEFALDLRGLLKGLSLLLRDLFGQFQT